METFNPFVLVLMFIVRCLVPLGIMLAISYILHRIGLIKDPPSAPPDEQYGGSEGASTPNGGLAHGKV